MEVNYIMNLASNMLTWCAELNLLFLRCHLTDNVSLVSPDMKW